MLRLYVLLILSILSNPIYSQYNKDSLIIILEDTSKSDLDRIEAGHTLVWKVYIHNSPDTALIHAKKILRLAKNLGELKKISSAYNSIGVCYNLKGDIKESLKYFKLSLEIDIELLKSNSEDMDAIINIGTSYSNIAVMYHQMGNMPVAILNYETALQLFDSLELKGADVNAKIANLQNNIGLANEGQGNIKEALSWYQKSLYRIEKEESKSSMSNTMSNIGNSLMKLSKDKKISVNVRDSLMEGAFYNFNKSLKIRRELGDRHGEANSLNNIAFYIQQMGLLSESKDLKLKYLKDSEDYYRKSIAIAEDIHIKNELAQTLSNLAENLLLQNRYNEAVELAQKALFLSQELEHIESMKKASGKLYQAFKLMGRNKEALSMYELHIELLDSIRNEENTRQLMRQQYEYDYTKRENELKFEQDKKDAIAKEQLKQKNQQKNAFIGGFLLMLLLTGISYQSYRRKKIDNIIITNEKARSDELLLNILPAEVAEELKAKGSAEAQLIDDATVLFTDFKGFTGMSELLSPRELVADLNHCFSAFDGIMQKHGIEKIKTIGDAYMAAGGLPTPNKTHAKDVVLAALEIRDFIEEGKTHKIANDQPFFEIRIGIHTGPLVAGIVGVKKFQYDIWGDTVNTASRMESSGEVGKVNISQFTYELLKEDPDFDFEHRGKISAKGKGEIEMLFVSLKNKNT